MGRSGETGSPRRQGGGGPDGSFRQWPALGSHGLCARVPTVQAWKVGGCSLPLSEVALAHKPRKMFPNSGGFGRPFFVFASANRKILRQSEQSVKLNLVPVGTMWYRGFYEGQPAEGQMEINRASGKRPA